MTCHRTAVRLCCAALSVAALGATAPAGLHQNKVDAERVSSADTAKTQPKLDRSGRKRVGMASFYADKFAGRRMADGDRMDPQANHAASRTLPLGTQALVTNLETGQSATVCIKDRGPYVKGRIVDLSPSTARAIGLEKEDGVALVQVVPIEFPQCGNG